MGTIFKDCSDIISRLTYADDNISAKKGGKTGIILGFQNGSPLGNDSDLRKIGSRLTSGDLCCDDLLFFGEGKAI